MKAYLFGCRLECFFNLKMLIMYKSSFLIFVFLLGTFVHATAQRTDTAQAIEVDVASQLPDVVIKEVAVYRQTPMAFEKLNLADIQRNNHGQDIPLVLENTVSAVATSDAGNGMVIRDTNSWCGRKPNQCHA